MNAVDITPRMVAAFMEASHDRNPLHADADYARTTPFGQPVVYGVLGVLAAFGQWSSGKPIQLKHLKAVFKKPLFEGVSYTFKSDVRNGRVYLSLGRGPVEYLQLNFLETDSLPENQNPEVQFDPGIMPPDIGLRRDYSYAANPSVLTELRALTGIGEGLAEGQLAALLWCSFWIGMVNPGTRALFAEVEFTFNAANSGLGLHFNLDHPEFDPRFNRITQTGTGSGIEALRLAAFIRPKPVELDWGLLREGDASGRPWQAKRAFVSGAGRGFGVALAARLGFAGASLALNVRSGAEALASRFSEEGIDASVFPADLTDAVQVEAMSNAIAQGPKLDLIILNATPAIRNAWLLEQEAGEFMEFLNASTAMTVLPIRALLPHLAENAMVVLVSTVYLDDPQRGFSHYHAAKAAQEAFLEALATEARGLRFVVARLPRMLTDQTNLPFDHHTPPRAELVAAHLLSALVGLSGDAGFRKLEIVVPEEE